MTTPSRASAFTLIELLVVVAIMGVIMLIAIPSVYYKFNKESMRKAAEELKEACTDARARAILDQRKTVLVISPDGAKSPSVNVQFGEGIVVDKLLLHGEDYTDLRTERDEARIQFHSDGTCDQALIRLFRPETGERCQFMLEAVTALVDVEWDQGKMVR
jgi:prepilin-type N-terminal cleavage/methylation domain-containing protein